MNKLIIENNTKYPTVIVLPLIIDIMRLGRIDNKSYCGVVMPIGLDLCVEIKSHRNTKSDTFTVEEVKR